MRPLRHKQDIGDAIQLIVQRSTDAAIMTLCGRQAPRLTDKSIHDLRRQFKVLRSLLELVRTDMGNRRYRQAKHGLRNASRPLAGARDAKAALITYNRVVRRCTALNTQGNRLTAALGRRLEEKRRIASTAGTRHAIAASLRTVEKLTMEWHASEGAWQIVSRGLRRLYMHGATALAATTAGSSAANLHELRKRSKELMYACEFLRKASPRSRSVALALKHCTDLLGKHHDLSVLQRLVAAGRFVPQRSVRTRLLDFIARDQAAVGRQATRIAMDIYRESANRFVRHVHRDWKSWMR
jgi:CHAD domain-containing protein